MAAPAYKTDEDVSDTDLPAILPLDQILEAENIAPLLDRNELTSIGTKVIRDVEIDEGSRKEWLKRYRDALDVAMQVRKAKSFPWPGASNVKYPLLTTASIQFQARAYPAIVDGSNLVKGRVLGPDPDGQKRARADRIGAHMTWQLLYRMPGWEEETDRLLLMLPIVGCVFRKTYYDPIAASNRSDMVTGEDFIVNYWAKSLETAPRYTHKLRLYPYEVQERIAAGIWLEVGYDVATENAADEDGHVEFYEQHRLIDLDGDGYPEPYVVTTNTDGEVARLVACFGKDDVILRHAKTDKATKLGALVEEDPSGANIGKVIRIERRQYFTKYGFIPAPDGSFYDIGFGALLYDISKTIDGTLNRMLDAGALQNAGGGFLGSGVNIKGGPVRLTIGEWKRADTTGGTLRDNVLPFNHQGPSPVLFQLLGLLIQMAKDITSSSDALTGSSPGTEQPTTLMARIEQAQKVMTAIFKRIHRAFGGDLRIMRRLNRDFLDEQEYFQLNDAEEASQIQRTDYEDDDLDVIPVSDPTAVGDIQRMARAQASMAFNGDPLVNQTELRQRFFEATGERDIKALMTPEPGPPNPALLIASMKQALEKQAGEAGVVLKHAQAADVLSDAAVKLASLGLANDAARLAAAATELGGDSEPTEPTAGAGGAEQLAEPPADPGIQGVPPAVADEAGAGMGARNDADPGATGTGGSVGPAGGPVA